MLGAAVCAAHGGRAPRVRQAAEIRKLREGFDRQFALAERRLRERRADWWSERIMFAAAVLERDPDEILSEFRQRGWLIDMVVGPHRWPLGLRTEDEPQLRWDRRFGRRL